MILYCLLEIKIIAQKHFYTFTNIPYMSQCMLLKKIQAYLIYSYKHTQFLVFENNFNRRIERNLRANITMTPKKEKAQKKYMASIFSTAVFNTRSVIFVEMTPRNSDTHSSVLIIWPVHKFPTGHCPYKLLEANRCYKSNQIQRHTHFLIIKSRIIDTQNETYLLV